MQRGKIVGDEDKAVKAGLEVVFQPVADLIQKIAGPAAEEFGLTLKDYARVVRLKRQVRLWHRWKKTTAYRTSGQRFSRMRRRKPMLFIRHLLRYSNS